MARKWPLSIEELQGAKLALYDQVSFAEIVSKYSNKVEETYSSSFTHKCICPNPQHKNGNERTPSFNFSEKDKGFVCFGCCISGDVFDLIALMEGKPWYNVVRAFLKQENIDLDQLDLESLKARATVSHHDYMFNVNLELSTKLRDYLKSIENKEYYQKEITWVDSQFRRIDNRFSKLSDTDFEQAHAFRSQMIMEIDRRKAIKESE